MDIKSFLDHQFHGKTCYKIYSVRYVRDGVALNEAFKSYFKTHLKLIFT